jgi:hypothetical protein
MVIPAPLRAIIAGQLRQCVPSFSIAVIKGTTVQWAQGVGLADLRTRPRPTHGPAIVGQATRCVMQRLNVLISGAGIAGMTLAYWLARNGARVTVVERGAGQRSSGSPVDVRGEAVAIAERMGILPRLRQAATDVAGLRFIDASGKVAARVDTRAMQRARGSRHVELARGELSTILHEASQDSAEFLFDDAIRTLDQDTDGVDVTFERASPRRFDLVVGADGLRRPGVAQVDPMGRLFTGCPSASERGRNPVNRLGLSVAAFLGAVCLKKFGPRPNL